MNDSLLDEKGDSTGTNFFYFPEGTYQIVSRASAASGPSQSAKWLLLVKWQMRGMVIDLDYVRFFYSLNLNSHWLIKQRIIFHKKYFLSFAAYW